MASPVVSLAALLVKQTKEVIFTAGIKVAQAIGLPVTTWQAGDPSRAQFLAQGELLESWEDIAIGFINSGFLTTALDPWLSIVAKQVFNVDVPPATFATTDVTLTNNGGGFYDEDELAAFALTFKCDRTGLTYHNITTGTLASGPGTTVTLTVEADQAGSASSAGPGEISDLVTGLLGVTCSNANAAVGLDQQSPSVTIQQCIDKIDTLSILGGPKGVYRYVARNSALTGTKNCTRARAYSDSDTGIVTLYVAGPSGGLAEADRALVEAAIVKYATPLCITPDVISATNVEIPVTYDVWIYNSVNQDQDDIEAQIAASIANAFASRDIGGDKIDDADGIIAQSLVSSAISSTFPQVFRVILTSPAADQPMGPGDVAILSTITPRVHMQVDP